MLRAIKRHRFLLLILALYSIYALFLIVRSSFVVEGVRYFTLFDDEMISMRYARNFAEGSGLIWNPGGERIEGITNPLWTLYMAIFHFFPLPSNLMGLPIQITGFVCMVGTSLYVRKLAQLFTKNRITILGTILFTLFYYPLNNWSVVLGTEVSVLVLLTAAATYYVLKQEKDKQFSYLPYVLLGVATGVRLDAVTVAGVILLYSWIRRFKKQRRELILATLIILGCVLLQEIMRFWYYHDLFPNTYYLKTTGYSLVLRVLRGLYVLKDSLQWLLLLAPLFVLISKRDNKLVLLLAIFLGQILYSIFVGGDAWEHFGGSNRYLSLAMPLFFIAMLISLHQLWTILREHYSLKQQGFIKFLPHLVLSILFLSLHVTNDTLLIQLLQLRPPQTVGENRQQVTMARLLERVSTKEATVGVVWAGIIPYYTNRYYYDLLGKNDRYIAHLDAHDLGKGQEGLKRFLTFYPGHMKWDTEYIAKKKLDLFIQVYPQDEAKKYLSDTYDQYMDSQGFLLTIRKDTKKVVKDGLRNIAY